MTVTEKDSVLILVPGAAARGGITNYYHALKPLFTLPVTYFERGARTWPVRKNALYEFSRIFRDGWKFYKLLRKNRFSLVQTTTSFSSLAILRDSVFIIIARLFKCRVIVFFRGWDEKFVSEIEKYALWLFKAIYFKADALIDLSKKNIERLKGWGYEKAIFLETTVVSKELIQDISEDYLQHKYNPANRQLNTLLYLARIETTKGIYEAIGSFRILQVKYPYLKLIIAGDGREEELVKDFVARNSIDNITFIGFVEGYIKRKVFMEADVYLFPSYFEGMPTSVLEAMAFGLPVITTNVGGLSDFFVNGIFGFITEENQSEIMAEMIERLINDPILAGKISLNNVSYARNHFLSDVVVKRIESIYNAVINN
jgi:glycosyltransferase involved in cell wall biosynthesis